jgi:hypothetical protein
LHASLPAIGSQQDEGERRNARVAHVADGCPRIRSQARGRDVVRDMPESWDVGDTPVAYEIVPQFPAGIEDSEAGRRRGGAPRRWRRHRPGTSCGQRNCSGRGHEHSH